MKKIVMAMLMAVCCLSASAQFEKGTKYASVSMSGLDLSFQKHQFNFGLNAKGGYFLEDAWMLYGQLGYDFTNIKGKYNDTNEFTLGAGARYYIRQNGLYLNMGIKFGHQGMWGLATGVDVDDEGNFSTYSFGQHSSLNNLYLTPEVGYCFYLNHFLSIEPALYYDMSLNHFSDCSRVGVRVGLGFYF